jgi:hypothetical protein
VEPSYRQVGLSLEVNIQNQLSKTICDKGQARPWSRLSLFFSDPESGASNALLVLGCSFIVHYWLITKCFNHLVAIGTKYGKGRQKSCDRPPASFAPTLRGPSGGHCVGLLGRGKFDTLGHSRVPMSGGRSRRHRGLAAVEFCEPMSTPSFCQPSATQQPPERASA